MSDRPQPISLSSRPALAAAWVRGWMIPALLKRRAFGVAFVASLVAAIYWGVVASDRYVSEAHIIVQQTDLNVSRLPDFGTLLGGLGQGNKGDQLLLADHLLSIDMLKKLDARLNLRAHYSDPWRDPLSRLLFEDAAMEWFYRHYRSRVSADLDEYSGVLIIKAQAYDPKMANAITAMLVEEGERYMNDMVHRLAQEQVAFLEKQLAQMGDRAMEARNALLNYQNRMGMISPQATVESLAGIVSGLQAKRIELQTRRAAMLGYMAPASPAVRELDQQIAALDGQIAREQARLAAPGGGTLNRSVEEFQRLLVAAEFAQDMYKTALVALERGRLDALRTIKKVSVVQSPSLPEYPVEPRRTFNITVFMLLTLLLAGIVHLVAAIVRDHRD